MSRLCRLSLENPIESIRLIEVRYLNYPVSFQDIETDICSKILLFTIYLTDGRRGDANKVAEKAITISDQLHKDDFNLIRIYIARALRKYHVKTEIILTSIDRYGPMSMDISKVDPFLVSIMEIFDPEWIAFARGVR